MIDPVATGQPSIRPSADLRRPHGRAALSTLPPTPADETTSRLWCAMAMAEPNSRARLTTAPISSPSPAGRVLHAVELEIVRPRVEDDPYRAQPPDQAPQRRLVRRFGCGRPTKYTRSRSASHCDSRTLTPPTVSSPTHSTSPARVGVPRKGRPRVTAATAAPTSVLLPARLQPRDPPGVGEQPCDDRRTLRRRALRVGIAQPHHAGRQGRRIGRAIVRLGRLEQGRPVAAAAVAGDEGGHVPGAVGRAAILTPGPPSAHARATAGPWGRPVSSASGAMTTRHTPAALSCPLCSGPPLARPARVARRRQVQRPQAVDVLLALGDDGALAAGQVVEAERRGVTPSRFQRWPPRPSGRRGRKSFGS